MKWTKIEKVEHNNSLYYLWESDKRLYTLLAEGIEPENREPDMYIGQNMAWAKDALDFKVISFSHKKDTVIRFEFSFREMKSVKRTVL